MTLEVYEQAEGWQGANKLYSVVINGYRVAGPPVKPGDRMVFSSTVKRKHLQTAIERGDEEWRPSK